MEFVYLFRSFLIDTGVAKATLKNYLSDLRFFLDWYRDAYQNDFAPEKLDEIVIEGFTTHNSPQMAYSSFRRQLSTLRKFSSYLKENNYIASSPFDKSAVIRMLGTVDSSDLEDLHSRKKLSDILFYGNS